MYRATDDYGQLFESLAGTRTHLESVLKVAAVSDDAFAWIMFAYVSAEDDDASYYKIKAIIGTELLNSAVSLKLDMAHRVADLAITEMVEQRELSKTHRATVLGVARASYYRNVHHYDGLLDMAKMVIVGWEVEAGMKILENSSC